VGIIAPPMARTASRAIKFIELQHLHFWASRLHLPNPPDVIHCHDLTTLPAAVKLRRRLNPSAKLIYDSHEFWPFQWMRGPIQQYWLQLENKYIHEADLVITVNASIAREMEKLYDLRRVETIFNSHGVGACFPTISEADFLRHFGAQPGGFRVVFQGGFIHGRNLEELVLAFELLWGDSIRLFLLGEGELEPRLRNLCKERGISNVHFGKWVPQDMLLAYVAHADMGVIPYSGDVCLNNYLCTPNKLFEYIEAGVPICAADLPELRKHVKQRDIGEVYPMRTTQEIAYALKDCSDRVKRGDFTPAALDTARIEMGWPKQRAKLLKLYEDLGV
jgi:glycosyltransferase involved in cell wall biosynthesis